MTSIYRETITVSGATGGAGVATATADSGNVNGIIRAVYLAYQGSPPAGTTDVTLTEGRDAPVQSILTVTNAATDGWFYPMAQAVNQANTAITNQGTPIAVCGPLTATIAQANNDDGVIVTVVYEQ